MAVALSIPTTTDGRHDDSRVQKRRIRTVTFSGSYVAAGEVVNASDVNLKRIVAVNPLGNPAETDLTGAWIVVPVVASTGKSCTLALFESAGAGLVHTQKPAEAYESGATVLVEFIGH